MVRNSFSSLRLQNLRLCFCLSPEKYFRQSGQSVNNFLQFSKNKTCYMYNEYPLHMFLCSNMEKIIPKLSPNALHNCFSNLQGQTDTISIDYSRFFPPKSAMMKNIHLNRINEPSHEIMVLFVLRKPILQTRKHSHPVGLDV